MAWIFLLKCVSKLYTVPLEIEAIGLSSFEELLRCDTVSVLCYHMHFLGFLNFNLLMLVIDFCRLIFTLFGLLMKKSL